MQIVIRIAVSLAIMVTASGCMTSSFNIPDELPPEAPQNSSFPPNSTATLVVGAVDLSRTVWGPHDYTSGRITLNGTRLRNTDLKTRRFIMDFRRWNTPNKIVARYQPKDGTVLIDLDESQYESLTVLLNSGRPLVALVRSYPQGSLQVAFYQGRFRLRNPVWPSTTKE